MERTREIISSLKDNISLLYSYLYQITSFPLIRHISYYLAIFVTCFNTHIEFIYYLCDWI